MVEKVEVPDFESVLEAMLDSSEFDGAEVKIDDHFSVKHRSWGLAELFYSDDFCNKTFDTHRWSIMCCDDDTEFAGSCASIVLDSFNKWYGRQCHPVSAISDITRYEQAEPFIDNLAGTERDVYMNACDYLYYGESLASLIERGHNYGLSESRTKEIWSLAFWYMAEAA